MKEDYKRIYKLIQKGADMENVYLLVKVDDGVKSTSLKTALQIIHFIDFLDCYEPDEWFIYDILSDINHPKQLRYVGWQPNCLIQLADENGDIVISGYGEDH